MGNDSWRLDDALESSDLPDINDLSGGAGLSSDKPLTRTQRKNRKRRMKK